jgi:hypothetical protein
MKFTANSIRHHASLIGVVGLTTFAFTAVACGGDEDTIPLTEWAAQFDQKCVATSTELSDPSLTQAEFQEISDAAINAMRAISEPDEMADTAAELLDVIEKSTDATERTQDEIDELDQRALTAMTSLGVSDACIGGPQG